MAAANVEGSNPCTIEQACSPLVSPTEAPVYHFSTRATEVPYSASQSSQVSPSHRESDESKARQIETHESTTSSPSQSISNGLAYVRRKSRALSVDSIRGLKALWGRVKSQLLSRPANNDVPQLKLAGNIGDRDEAWGEAVIAAMNQHSSLQLYLDAETREKETRIQKQKEMDEMRARRQSA